MTTQIKAGVIAANAVNSSELASGALSGQNFTGDVTFDTTTLVIDSTNNRIGIGTTNPEHALHVNSGTTNTVAQFQSTDSNAYIEFLDSDAGASGCFIGGAGDDFVVLPNASEKFRVTSSGNVGIGTSSPVNNGANSQGLTINGSGNYQNLNLQVGGTTQFTIYTNGTSGTFISQVTADPMMFYTSDTERMRIASDGAVVVNNSGGDAQIYLGGTSGTARMYLARTSADSLLWNVSNGNLRFGTNDTERMRIDSSGNVGIATTDPKSTLEVKGTFGAPATSGFASGFITRFSQSSGVGSLDVGFGDPYSWLQSRASNNYATNFALALNPNGGNVGIGTTSAYKSLTVGDSDASAWITSGGSNTHLTLSANGVSGAVIFRTGGTNGDPSSTSERMRITSAGHIAITSGKRFYFNVNSIGNGDTYIDEYSANEVGITTGGSRKLAVSGGNLYVAGTINANHNFSDERLKENIVVIPNALEKISNLRGITFTRKDDGSVGTGLIAQELEKVLPQAVYEAKMVEGLENPDAESWKSINYGNTVGLLVEAIKEQQTIIDDLKSRLDEAGL